MEEHGNSAYRLFWCVPTNPTSSPLKFRIFTWLCDLSLMFSCPVRLCKLITLLLLWTSIMTSTSRRKPVAASNTSCSFISFEEQSEEVRSIQMWSLSTRKCRDRTARTPPAGSYSSVSSEDLQTKVANKYSRKADDCTVGRDFRERNTSGGTQWQSNYLQALLPMVASLLLRLSGCGTPQVLFIA